MDAATRKDPVTFDHLMDPESREAAERGRAAREAQRDAAQKAASASAPFDPAKFELARRSGLVRF